MLTGKIIDKLIANKSEGSNNNDSGQNPPKMPYFVKEGYAITALCVIVFVWPMWAFVYKFYNYLSKDINSLRDMSLQTSVGITFIIASAFVMFPPMWIAGSKASRYLVSSVKYYNDIGNIEMAKGLVSIFGNYILFRDWKRNPWFRKFVAENQLQDKSANLAKFHGKMP